MYTLNFIWKGYVIMPYKKEYHQLTCSRCNQVFEVLTPAYLRRLKDPKYGSICPTCRRRIQQEEMSPEERKRRTEKALVSRKKTLENMDPEQRAAWTKNKSDKVKKAWANMDEDQKKDLSERRSKIQSDRMANMSEEQLAVIGKNISIGKKLAFANMTEEEREANRERMREERKVYWASRTDEQKEEIIDRLRKNAREFWDDESNKEKQDMIIGNLKKGVRDYWDNISDEDKQVVMDRLNVGYRNWRDNLTDDQKQKINARISVQFKDWWANMPDYQRKEYLEKRHNLQLERMRNPEYRKQFSEKMKQAHAEWWNNLSEEQKEIHREHARNMWNNMSPEKRQEVIAKIKQRYAEMTDEQWDDFKRKVSEGNKRYYASLSKEQQDEIRERGVRWWNNLSDEQKAEHSQYTKDWWANLSEDEYEDAVYRQHAWIINMPEDQKKEFFHKIFSNMNKVDTKPEIRFRELFDSSRWSGLFTLKQQDVVEWNGIKHAWDYGIYDKSGKLVMLIDIDGMMFHGDLCEYNDRIGGYPTMEFRRQFTIPDGVKCNILSDNDLDNEFDLAMKELDLTYDQYLERRFNAIRNYGFPFPNRTSKQLRLSFDSLRKFVNSDIDLEKYHRFTFIGNWLIDQFHPSIYYCNRVDSLSPYDAIMNDVALKYLIDTNTIYRGVINYNKLLQGMTMSDIAPVVDVFSPGHAVMLIRQYLSEFDTIYDPFSSFSSRMLGALACGKSYIGNDISMIMTNESSQLFDWLKTNYPDIPDAKLSCADVNDQYGEYPCLFTCVPYSNYEQWIDAPDSDMTADDWIDLCMDHFKCNRYVFIVDYTEKYTDNLVGVIGNVLGSGIDQYVIKIDRQ